MIISDEAFTSKLKTHVFKTPNEFSKFIEEMAQKHSLSPVETIIEYCRIHLLDPGDVVTKLNKSLKEKIIQEFRDLNYLPKRAQLDMD